MHLRPVRLALHVAAVTALAGSSVLLVGAPGHAADAARPESYGGDATATALHFMADRKPQPTPVSDAFHVELPYASTSMDSSGSATATAASAYPGAGLLGVPALLCQFAAQLCSAPFPAVPRYPLIATASYPTSPDDHADAAPGPQVLGPLTVSPNVTAAHADQTRVEALTEAAGAGVNGVVSADSATTHSTQSFEGSTLVLTAVSTVKGLDIGGGALHIDAVRSVASARLDGAEVTAASATTTITGATAGGVPVSIDSTGIHVAGNGDDGAAQSAANTALNNLDATGIAVRMLTTSRLAKPGVASAATGGLLVTFTHAVDLPVPALPPVPLPGGPPNPNGQYSGSVTLAGAGVTAFAAPAQDFTLPPVDLPGVGAVSPPVGGASQPGLVTAPPVSTGEAPAFVAPGGTTPPALADAGHRKPAAAVLGLDLIGERLRLLTLVLLGYPLLVLLSAPVRAPARLPRAL